MDGKDVICEIDDDTAIRYLVGDPGKFWEVVDGKFIPHYDKYLEYLFKLNYISTSKGWLSLYPNGYDDIIDEFNTLKNITDSCNLPEGMIQWYSKPNFEEFNSFDDVEDWLANNIRTNEEMGKEEFARYYADVAILYKRKVK